VNRCRVSFVHFIAAIQPDFVFSDFSRRVANDLQRFYIATQRGEMPNLLLEAPPQHGKSREAAELFPAWVLGINPDIRVSVATYAFPLAKKRNMEIQRVMATPAYRQIFPETKLRTSNDPTEGEKTAEGFDIVKRRGGARFVGVGGSLTGFSTDIGIIDDPYKDMQQARSSTQNNAVIEWYNSVFKTRMSKVSGSVLMLTRWTTNDLAAWCATNEDWTEVKYRAIENGKALVPSLHPLEQLLKIKASMPAVIWEAMYQQNPFIQGGNVIREEWLQYYQTFPERFERIFITGDTAQKAKEHNDFTVFSVWGTSENALYWLDLWRDKVTSPGLRKAAKDIWSKWHPGYGETRASGFYVEDKASGTGLIQDLQVESAIPIVPIQRDKDKYTRLLDVLNYIQAGRLYIPANAPWTNVAIGEMAAFSADMKHANDDIVDTMIDGLTIAFGPGNVSMFDVL